MLVGAKVCDLTEDLLWFVCGLYVSIMTSSLIVIFDKSATMVGSFHGFSDRWMHLYSNSLQWPVSKVGKRVPCLAQEAHWNLQGYCQNCSVLSILV